MIYIHRSGDISIHTPAKGVTLHWYETFGFDSNFNPHPREGGDGIIMVENSL